MPHLIIEYSENLATAIDIAGLTGALHETAVTLEALPTGGIRTRAVPRSVFKVADGHPDNGFISVIVRMAKGRSPAARKEVGETLFSALVNHVHEVFERRPLSLALEIQEIDPQMRWKQSNIREYMAERGNPGRAKS